MTQFSHFIIMYLPNSQSDKKICNIDWKKSSSILEQKNDLHNVDFTWGEEDELRDSISKIWF